MYICICNGVTDHQIRQCAREGVCSLSALQAELGIAAGCGQCAQIALTIAGEEARMAPPACFAMTAPA